jgi:Asp-tRNA(Asn)/Glu-tRNA(Gln) amidotransferase A subunit family amidase
MPEAVRPRALAVLETPGWELATPAAKAALANMVERLRAAGIAVRDRKTDALIESIEGELREARPISERANAWESRWPLNTYRAKNAAGLSRSMLERLDMAERMHIEDYRRTIAERARIRSIYAKLADVADGAVTLPAIGAAPRGLESTGNPIFAIPGSMLGVPAVSLPLLEDEALPLGLQLMGFEQQDAALMGVAAWVETMFQDRRDA